MTESQIARKLEDAARRYGRRAAVANVLRELDYDDAMHLWRKYGSRILRDVWRRHRPNLELVRSIREALRQAIAIGNTGESKALGDVTAADLRVIAQFRQRMSETLAEQSRCLRRVAGFVGQRTVAEAWEDIPASERAAMLDAFGIAEPEQARAIA